MCKKLIECYTSRNIDLNKVRGQTYDTTSSMSSVVNGVHGSFRAVYNKAIYFPCNAHILNLCISSSCTLQPARKVIDIMNECFLILSQFSKEASIFCTCFRTIFSYCNAKQTKRTMSYTMGGAP